METIDWAFYFPWAATHGVEIEHLRRHSEYRSVAWAHELAERVIERTWSELPLSWRFDSLIPALKSLQTEQDSIDVSIASKPVQRAIQGRTNMRWESVRSLTPLKVLSWPQIGPKKARAILSFALGEALRKIEPQELPQAEVEFSDRRSTLFDWAEAFPSALEMDPADLDRLEQRYKSGRLSRFDLAYAVVVASWQRLTLANRLDELVPALSSLNEASIDVGRVPGLIVNMLKVHTDLRWRTVSALRPFAMLRWPGVGRQKVQVCLAFAISEVLGTMAATLAIPGDGIPNSTVGVGDSEKQRIAARDREVTALRARGLTLGEIGDQFGVSRERIRQILKRVDGPSMSVLRQNKAAERDRADKELAKLIDRDIRTHPGTTWEEAADRLRVSRGEVRRLASDEVRNAVINRRPARDLAEQRATALSALQRAATYAFPLTTNRYQELLKVGEIQGPSIGWVMRLFGSWTSACEAAGVECGTSSVQYQSRWTEDDALHYITKYMLSPGARGTFSDYGRWQRAVEPDAPSNATLAARFGSWSDLKRRALLRSARGTADTEVTE